MKGMTRQGTNWEKIFASYVSVKGLVTKRTLKTTVKKKVKLVNQKVVKRHFTERDVRMVNKDMKIFSGLLFFR